MVIFPNWNPRHIFWLNVETKTLAFSETNTIHFSSGQIYVLTHKGCYGTWIKIFSLPIVFTSVNFILFVTVTLIIIKKMLPDYLDHNYLDPNLCFDTFDWRVPSTICAFYYEICRAYWNNCHFEWKRPFGFLIGLTFCQFQSGSNYRLVNWFYAFCYRNRMLISMNNDTKWIWTIIVMKKKAVKNG